MSLITLSNLKSKLIQSKEFDNNSLPSDDTLSLFIEVSESLIIDWLGYNPELQQYTEKLKANDRCLVNLSYYPVSKVDSIIVLLPEQPPKPLDIVDVGGLWYGKHTIYVNYKNTLVEVIYWAGFDPLPSLFEVTIYLLINNLLSINSDFPDISTLNEPTKDISSLSLPGGLSKSYKYGNTKSSSSSYAGTKLERILTPLRKYRRQYRF